MVRFLALAILWWVLTEGEISALALGVAVALVVALLTSGLFPPSGYRIRLRRLPCFLFFFVTRSTAAGFDVARRLLLPSLPVNPGIRILPLRLPAGGPRWLLANVLSLLPGTLSVQLHERGLELHCLDLDMPVTASMRDAERHVALLFELPGDWP
ncbi:Na+/H+ antiporter subunit E [Zobellella sp. DQSA1]|uniref:Na+/H+ antiporter subunit E n=1 Tax=Zobellella sp. DQSA1 TaxID=3342386 RepID=UPI0035C02F60